MSIGNVFSTFFVKVTPMSHFHLCFILLMNKLIDSYASTVKGEHNAIIFAHFNPQRSLTSKFEFVILKIYMYIISIFASCPFLHGVLFFGKFFVWSTERERGRQIHISKTARVDTCTCRAGVVLLHSLVLLLLICTW